ncbi:GGDEF domain-containing protein [Xenophilus sp. AP218F]|nr:GGDEF domain-containing protein [Xenophilus sp. AP218F]
MEAEIVEASKEVLARSLEFVPIPILISESLLGSSSPSRRFHRYLNQAFIEQIGYTLQQMPNMEAWYRLAYPDPDYRRQVERDWSQAVREALAQGRNLAEMTAQVCCANGERRWFIVTAQLKADLLPGWNIVTFRDVHDLKCMMDANERLSRTDFLTGLDNRREATRHLDAAWLRWELGGEPFSILLCDLDHFKQVNDVYGHASGDQALISVAGVLRQACPRAKLSRWGGEEFLVLLTGGDVEMTDVIAQRACDRVRRKGFVWEGQPLPLTMSVGYATIRPEQTLTSLLQCADAALYLAKERGRNQALAG